MHPYRRKMYLTLGFDTLFNGRGRVVVVVLINFIYGFFFAEITEMNHTEKLSRPVFFCLDCRGMYKIKCSKEPETNAFHSYKWIAGFKNNRIWSSYKINVFGSMRMSTRYHRLDNYNYKMALLCVPIFTLLLRLFYKLTLTDDGVGFDSSSACAH